MSVPATKRERMLGALKRKLEGYVPWDINPSPSLLAKWRELMGTKLHPQDYYDSDFRGAGMAPTTIQTDWKLLNPDMPSNAVYNESGVPRVPADSKEGHHFTHMLPSALKMATSVKEVETYPWPDMDAEYRWSEVPGTIRDLHDRGYAAVCGVGGYFEGMSWMRGPDVSMVELMTDEPVMAAIVERTVFQTNLMAERMAKSGADILMFGDDIGMQDRMMISPELWRRWFKKPFAKAIRMAKSINPELLVFFHSDGYIEPVIPDLVDIGLDILNPVQPECMDPEKIKKRYGGRLSFWGTVGVQSTMPFGSPKEIRQLVRRRIDRVAKGGGLFLSPAHMLEPEVPLENVLAFVDAVREFGGHQYSASNASLHMNSSSRA